MKRLRDNIKTKDYLAIKKSKAFGIYECLRFFIDLQLSPLILYKTVGIVVNSPIQIFLMNAINEPYI